MPPAPIGASGLAIFTPDAITAQLSKWIRAYNSYSETIAPHITLAYRGFASIDEWRLVRAKFAEAVGAFEPFDIALRTTGVFEGEDSVLWLKPDDDGSLMRLRSDLAQRFQKYFPAEPHPYVPHLTIGFFDSRDACLQAQATVRAEMVSLSFRVNALTFIVNGEGGKWSDADHLALGVNVSRVGSQ